MENVSCNVIYVDRSVSRDRSVRAGEQNSDRWAAEWESPHVAQNVGLLLEVFDEGAPLASRAPRPCRAVVRVGSQCADLRT